MNITDEMVKAAVAARKAFLINLRDKNAYENAAMRDALEAAFNSTQREQIPNGADQ
jgi:hypothetical protein